MPDIKISVIDATFMRSWKEFKKMVKTESPDILGFSFSSPLADDAYQAIKLAKKVCPEALIIAGGPHPTVDPVSVIKKGVKIAVIGEGEKSLVQIINSFKRKESFSKVESAFYRDGQKIKYNPRISYIENLDSLPIPDRSLLDINRYIDVNGSLHMLTTRGCPFNCFFCQPTQRKLFGVNVRANSPERVIEEIKNIVKNYGKKKFVLFINDDTFTFDEKRVKKICNLMIKNKFDKIPWWCHSRVNTFTEIIARAIKNAGCIGVSFGVESGSQRILSEILRKGITVEQTEKAFKIAHKYGILTLAYLMIGSPTETVNDLEATNRLIAKIHPDIISISRTTPVPGSALYDYAKKKRILNLKTSADFGYYGDIKPLKLDTLKEKEIEFYKSKWTKTWLFSLYKNFFKYIKLLIPSNTRFFLIKNAIRTIKKKLKFLS
ncbi:MAG: B12-binding domain-containing radical SAM protein [Candidatus Omnitrophica bacterium]|nr:B12-binding domain-containing radical SAM protein [Candidatus Omnitrophota bacterium]